MEEKIIEILENELGNYIYGMGSSAKEISSLFREFFAYQDEKCELVRYDLDWYWECEGGVQRRFASTDSLFQFWLNNIYNK